MKPHLSDVITDDRRRPCSAMSDSGTPSLFGLLHKGRLFPPTENRLSSTDRRFLQTSKSDNDLRLHENCYILHCTIDFMETCVIS